jgi:hypothetical protein
MTHVWPWFLEAVVATAAGGMIFGIAYIVKLLIKVQHALDHLGPSVQTLYLLQTPILRTLRHQNNALKEAGANGSTDKANACVDEAEEIIGKRHASLEMSLGTPAKPEPC